LIKNIYFYINISDFYSNDILRGNTRKMTQYQNKSILISNLLTDIGYGEKMIAFRRKIYKNTTDVYNDEIHPGLRINIFIVGSKAEGVTAPLENDVDVMEVLPDAVCKEHSNSVTHRLHIFLVIF
jgi:hypothetical protein